MAKNTIVNPNDQTIFSAFKEGWKSLDVHSWPGMIMFLTLIGIEALVNIIASIPEFGIAISVGVGLLFGVFLGGWHVITERPSNSIKQQSTVEFLVKFVGGASILLIITNLLRLNGQINLMEASLLPSGNEFRFFDYVAIVIIGIVFAVHLFGYLQWHGADDARKASQEFNRKMAKVTQAGKDAQLANQRAEIRLEFLDAQITKDKELRLKYAHLPAEQLDKVCREAAREIRVAFEKTYSIDLDDDGEIGEPSPNKPPAAPTRRPHPDLAPGRTPSARVYTLDELLGYVGKTEKEVVALLQSNGLTDADEAFQKLGMAGYLPEDMTRGNFVKLFNEYFTPTLPVPVGLRGNGNGRGSNP